MGLKQFLSRQVKLEVFLAVQVVSMLFTLASAKVSMKVIAHKAVLHPIQKIIQVGEEKQALSTQYLLELLALSYDKPQFFERANKEELLERVKKSPLIESAFLETVYPDAIYLEYKTRRPLALLEDFKNTALDRGGNIFPVKPFLTAKRLPKIYLGLKESFDADSDKFIQNIHWNRPMQDPKLDLAFSLLDFMQQTEGLKALLRVQRIDVSKAFEKSYGKRSIVVIDEIVLNSSGTKVLKAILRLHHKQFTQGLINYSEWKTHYLKEHFDKIEAVKDKKALVIDLRIPQMAFVEEII